MTAERKNGVDYFYAKKLENFCLGRGIVALFIGASYLADIFKNDVEADAGSQLFDPRYVTSNCQRDCDPFHLTLIRRG